MTDVIAASAAIAAAIFSLVAALMSTWSVRTIEDRRWRRESARKSARDYLNAVDDLIEAWKIFYLLAVSAGVQNPLEGPPLGFNKIHDATEHVRRHLAELELIASTRCLKLAHRVAVALSFDEFDRIAETDTIDGPMEWWELHVENRAERARQEFIVACRRDLGAGRGVKMRPWPGQF
jgi:hypothetical protein